DVDTRTFCDTRIQSVAPNGTVLATISIQRDSITNDITTITDPAGNKVVYSYDTDTGDLTGVSHQDSLGNVVTSVTLKYEAPQPHYLTGILDSKGTALLTVSYDPTTGRVTSITDANGNQSTT